MAIEFGKNRTQDFAPANLMSFGKSFSRMGAQPLDMNEVWYDLEALKTYAKINATAYVGMRLVYVDAENSKITVYAIKNIAGDLVELATAADIQSLENAIAAIEDTNTTYGFSFDKETQKLTVTPSEGAVTVLDLSDFLVASELPEDKNTEYHLEYADKAIKLVAGADPTKMSIDAAPFIKDGMLSDVDYDPTSNTLTFVWNTDSGLKADTVVLSDILDPYTAGDKIVIDGSRISHAAIAAPTLVAGGSGRTYITELVTDDYGHITGYKVATETDQEIPKDTNTHYTLSSAVPENIDNVVNLVLSSDDTESIPNLVPIKGSELITVSKDESNNILISTPGLSNELFINDNNEITLNLGVGLDIDSNNQVSVLTPTDGHIVINSNNELTLGALPVYTTSEVDGKVIKTLVTPGTGIFKDVYTKEETNDAIADAVKVATGGESASDVLIELNNYKKKVNLEIWGDESGTGVTIGEQTNQSRIDIIAAEIGDLTKLVRDEGRENTTLVDEINYINERLTWGEMGE